MNNTDFFIAFKLGEYDIFYSGLGCWNFCYDDKDWSIDYTLDEAKDIIMKYNKISQEDKYCVLALMQLNWENPIMALRQVQVMATNKYVDFLKKINFRLQVR